MSQLSPAAAWPGGDLQELSQNSMWLSNPEHRTGQAWAGNTTLGDMSIMALSYIAVHAVYEEGMQFKDTI